MHDVRGHEPRFWAQFGVLSAAGALGAALEIAAVVLIGEASALWMEVILRIAGFTASLGLVSLSFFGGAALFRALLYPADSEERIRAAGLITFVLEPLLLLRWLVKQWLASRRGHRRELEGQGR